MAAASDAQDIDMANRAVADALRATAQRVADCFAQQARQAAAPPTSVASV